MRGTQLKSLLILVGLPALSLGLFPFLKARALNCLCREVVIAEDALIIVIAIVLYQVARLPRDCSFRHIQMGRSNDNWASIKVCCRLSGYGVPPQFNGTVRVNDRIDRSMDGWMDGWTDGRVDGWTHGRMDKWREGGRDGWMEIDMIDWLIDRRDGRMDGWMDGGMDGRMDGGVHRPKIEERYLININR